MEGEEWMNLAVNKEKKGKWVARWRVEEGGVIERNREEWRRLTEGEEEGTQLEVMSYFPSR